MSLKITAHLSLRSLSRQSNCIKPPFEVTKETLTVFQADFDISKVERVSKRITGRSQLETKQLEWPTMTVQVHLINR